MVHYQETRVKLTNIQLRKLNTAAKYKKGIILRLAKKNFEDEKLPHELFIAIKKAIKICNVIANNTSAEIKLSKVQILKPFQRIITVL